MQIGHIARWGVALVTMMGVLDGSIAVAQSVPASGHAVPALRSPRLARTPAQPPARRTEQGASDDQRQPATHFERGSLQLALGAASFWERPAAQPKAATFLSAGLHLSPSLAVVGEMGRGWWASDRLETPGRAEPAACAEIHAGSTPSWEACSTDCRGSGAAHGSSRSSPAARHSPANELDSGASSSCFRAFSSGFALAAGGGVDVHLTDRLALRIAADYRRLAIPALEGTERVFMEGDADHHLGMVRVTGVRPQHLSDSTDMRNGGTRLRQ